MADKRKGRKKDSEKLTKGTILTDLAKVCWSILEPIGEGGFGIIYSAKKVGSAGSTTYAAKVEPHGNGPLFVERNFFIRNLKPEMIDGWKQKMKLPFLGLPKYMGSGTYVANSGVDHRFLIMERFGDNINSRLKRTGKSVDVELLVTFCSQIIDSLRYIHAKGYAHMDIKPENLLLKYKSNSDQVYLIDFGIIDKYATESAFKPDKKKQHNGTLLYCSRDSHSGVVTMRGDLEILGYNILAWCGYEFPWAKCLKTPASVHEKKNELMSNLQSLKSKVPAGIVEYLQYVDELKHNEMPDYERIKNILRSFSNADASSVRNTPKKRKSNVVANDERPLNNHRNEHDRDGLPEKVCRTKSRKTPDENAVTSASKPKKIVKRVGRTTSAKTK